jgi:hypothetical protein
MHKYIQPMPRQFAKATREPTHQPWPSPTNQAAQENHTESEISLSNLIDPGLLLL